jgi:hypothetical protein
MSDETNATDGTANITPLLPRSSLPLLLRCFGDARVLETRRGRQNPTTGNKEPDRRP